VWIWFRDDDISAFEPTLENVLRFFGSQEVPILLSVIPERLSLSHSGTIKSYDGVSIGQHGFSHKNYAQAGQEYSELSGDRDISTVLTEQKAGRAILEKSFGKKYTDIFIPPWSEISDRVYEKLSGEGYVAFSIWCKNGYSKFGTPEINAQVDLIDWTNFNDDIWRSDEHFGGEDFAIWQILTEMDYLLEDKWNVEAAIGILLHHRWTGKKTLAFLNELLTMFRKYPENVELCSVHEALALVKRNIYTNGIYNRKALSGTDGDCYDGDQMATRLERYLTIDKQNLDIFLKEHTILICALRNSRIRCKQLAIIEMSSVLEAYEGVFITNCPLASVKGKIAFWVPNVNLPDLPGVLATVGYCDRFYTASFREIEEHQAVSFKGQNLFVWKKRNFWVRDFFCQSQKTYLAQSSHNRPFRIFSNGGVKDVTGYRGNGSDMGRRALPIEDCRCLLHLAFPRTKSSLLDPFAGGGGILFAASVAALSLELFSADIDEVVAPGLEMYSSRHFCGDSTYLDFGGLLFDMVVTEIPFSREATEMVLSALINIGSHLKNDGRFVLMCAQHQSQSIRTHLNDMGYFEYLFYSVNRKGTDVDILAYTMSEDAFKDYVPFLERIKVIY